MRTDRYYSSFRTLLTAAGWGFWWLMLFEGCSPLGLAVASDTLPLLRTAEEAKSVSFEQLTSGREDSQFVEVATWCAVCGWRRIGFTS